MKRLVLALAGVLLAAVTAAALATAGPAPKNGRLVVVNENVHSGVASGPSIVTMLPANTYRTTVYVPAGYVAPGGVGKIGNSVGKATVFGTTSTGARVTMTGTLTVVDPTRYQDVTNPLKFDFENCATSTKHSAVWLLSVKQTTGSASTQFPVFVDRTGVDTKNGSPWAAYQIQYCAHAAANLKLNIGQVDLKLVRMFNNPDRRGMYFWRAVFEPLAAGGKSAQSTGSALVAAAVPVAPQVTLRWHRLNGTTVIVSGRVTAANQSIRGVKVQVYAGANKRLQLSHPSGVARTNAVGQYVIRLHAKPGSWWVRAKATTPYLALTDRKPCASATAGLPSNITDKGCVDTTLSPFRVLSTPVSHER